MNQLQTGDEVRIDIPDRDDPDFDVYHERLGVIVDVLSDDASTATGDARDNVLYRVRFDDGDEMDFRWRDLRPL